MLRFKPEFSQQSTWRSALGASEPLLVASDPEWGSLDAKDVLPAGSSRWDCLIARGVGAHLYGAAGTVWFRS
jgi:hypothetical protein